MSDKKSSKARIERIEKIPLIYGYISSGAKEKYITKKDFPKLLVLIEGGYAVDIFLKKDIKKERIIIEDTPVENISNSFKDEMMEEANDFLGILDSGVSSGLSNALEKVGKENKAVFWCNGIWSIIEEHLQENNLFIPIELASRIINRAGISNINDLLSSLNTVKFKNEKFESVSAKQLADLLGMGDLYSIWRYDNRVTCMLNTDMREGPYKIQRIYENVEIRVSIKFIYNESNTSGTIFYKLIDKDYNINDYKNTIINAFKSWGGTYKEENAEFGNGAVTIKVDILIEGFNKSAGVKIINSKSKDDKEIHISNVECKDNWRVNYIGEMTQYNHYKDIQIESSEYKREVKHEFGHFIGLGDAYNGADETEEVAKDDIMWEGEKISSNDIEMLLMAALKNQKQYFYSKGEKIKSEAITY